MGKSFVIVLGPTGGLWPFIWGAGYEVRQQLEAEGLVFKGCGGDSGGAMASALLASDADPVPFMQKNAKYTKHGAIGGKNPWTWTKNILSFVMHGGAIYANNAYRDAIKPAWESLGVPKHPCYAWAWSLSSENSAIFPLHTMDEDGWAMGITASMSLPAALSPFAWPNQNLKAQAPTVFEDLKIPAAHEDATSYFADGGISSYLPVDMILDCPELQQKMTFVDGEWQVDWETKDMPLTIAISMDDFQSPKFRTDIKDMNPFKKIIFACMGALRSSVHEDIDDLKDAGIPGVVLQASPGELSRFGLKFDVSAEDMVEMFEAGRAAVKEETAYIIRKMFKQHAANDADFAHIDLSSFWEEGD